MKNNKIHDIGNDFSFSKKEHFLLMGHFYTMLLVIFMSIYGILQSKDNLPTSYMYIVLDILVAIFFLLITVVVHYTVSGIVDRIKSKYDDKYLIENYDISRYCGERYRTIIYIMYLFLSVAGVVMIYFGCSKAIYSLTSMGIVTTFYALFFLVKSIRFARKSKLGK
ncbi:MAG: hypothetical protein Q4G13_02295 [Moraxella sp.]|nr:hypothetical protein [Moraxella sp.]